MSAQVGQARLVMGEGRGEGFLPEVSPYALTRLASLATLFPREREKKWLFDIVSAQKESCPGQARA